MPLTVQTLQQKLLSEIAPGNPERFRELLAEADELLLNSGKWRWVRKSIVLEPVGNLVVLPAGYQSIMGARLGNEARSVGWEEVEFLEDGPGRIPIQGGCDGLLIDQGLLMIPDGGLDYSFSDLQRVGNLVRSFDVNSYPSWSTTGSVAPPTNDFWVRVYWQFGAWRVQIFEDQVMTGIYGSETTVSLTPVGVNFEEGDAGLIVFTDSETLRRCYKVTDADVKEVTVLARFEPKVLNNQSDIPHCQSFSALKRAMLSIIFEGNNEITNSANYFEYAKKCLDEQEESYRGSAKQVFKPSLFGALRRRSTNFP